MSNAREIAQLGSVPSGRRNLIINGAMNVAQRGTSETGVGATSGYFVCDRWKYIKNGTPTAVYTLSQDTTGPTGFGNSFKIATTTADATPTGLSALSYFPEAQDLQSLGYGSSDAKTSTLSFWVKSSQTGTGAILVYQFDGGVSLTLNYTINSADTWEFKELTIPANTSNAIANDNTAGLEFDFVVMSDSATYGVSPQTTWDTYDSTTRAYGQTINVAASTSDYWQITGVQLEVGSVATEFEHRSYGEELALCQRYYYNFSSGSRVGIAHRYGVNGSAVFAGIFPVEMRASPTISSSGTINFYNSIFTAVYSATISNTIGTTAKNFGVTFLGSSSGHGVGEATTINLASGQLIADAEL